MTNLEIQNKFEELFKNEAFCEHFFDNIDNVPVVKQLLSENGVAFSDEEVTQFVDFTKKNVEKQENGELAEDELDDVSGGSVIAAWVVAGVVSGVVSGFLAYKARKWGNKTYDHIWNTCDTP